MDMSELLKHDLGHDQADDLDTAPPLALLMRLRHRSGIDLDQLRCMSFAGWVPWLLDSLDEQLTEALRTYALQFSVLLPRNDQRPRLIKYWRAWLPIWPIHRACPLCLDDSADQALLLMWKLPLMLSCPLHGCWLENYRGAPGQFSSWEDVDCAPREASDAIMEMDRRTWQALTAGYVDMPRRRIHAGVWFRLLRTIIEELNTPLSQCDGYAENIRNVWADIGQPLRAGQRIWRRFEHLGVNIQLRMLEAAAAAIQMLGDQMLATCGEEAKLFWPEPKTAFTNGFELEQEQQYSGPIMESVIGAIVDAQHNPDTARLLFSVVAYGYREDPARVREMRTLFDELGIPREFLSHYVPTNPFTLHTLNDGLNDIF
eukprot:TRINITY_DN22078_c0_g1_i1.p1 TRINITY_DN22078_c0_g1~~TRINITY_DN22078_c0_g1_i1.p1  ORF type:complete len:372 (+),score=27.12 TRINITY_DN22078_c0_g1_i1:444-1559(+)